MTSMNRRTLTVVVVAAIVIVLAAGVYFSDRGDGGSGGADAGTSATSGTDSAGEGADPREVEKEVGLARRDADDVTAMGDKDADLVLIEYSDYRCPFCGAFARDTLPKLKEEYIDTGKVRYEWRDFPVFGEESVEGAMAARAAGEQGLYREYNEAMYADAPERGHLKINRDKVMAWAEEVGVPDMDQFEKDLDDPDLRAKVEADTQEARQVGATGTPAFVLGDQLIAGAQPVDSFRQLLDEELAAVEQN